jgi:hypothetical protein
MEVAIEHDLYVRACRALQRRTEAHGFSYNQPSKYASGHDARSGVITLRDNGDRVLARYRYDERRARLQSIDVVSK